MRESVSERYFNGASLDPVRGKKEAKLIALLACCLLLTACPPSGGELVPLAQEEGAELLTTNFRNDTVRVSREQVNIKARGVWSIADSNTSVILEISNANAEAVTVDFNRCGLVNSDSGEKLSLRSASDETAGSGPTFLSDNVVTIGSQQERRFALEFKISSADASSSVMRNVLGQTVTLRIPVAVKAETPAKVEFVFTFKYAEGQR